MLSHLSGSFAGGVGAGVSLLLPPPPPHPVSPIASTTRSAPHCRRFELHCLRMCISLHRHVLLIPPPCRHAKKRSAGHPLYLRAVSNITKHRIGRHQQGKHPTIMPTKCQQNRLRLVSVVAFTSALAVFWYFSRNLFSAYSSAYNPARSSCIFKNKCAVMLASARARW